MFGRAAAMPTASHPVRKFRESGGFENLAAAKLKISEKLCTQRTTSHHRKSSGIWQCRQGQVRIWRAGQVKLETDIVQR